MAHKPGIGILLLVSALFNFTFDGINSSLGIFVVDKFSALPWAIGLLFVMAGLATAFMQGTLVRTLIPKYGEKRMAIVALSGEGIGALLVLLAPAFWMLFPIVFLQSAVVSFIFSALSTMAANRVAEHEQGQLAGVSAAVSGLVAALGPLWAGAVYDYVMPSAPLWMGAILLGIACLLMAQVRTAQAPKKTTKNFPSEATGD